MSRYTAQRLSEEFALNNVRVVPNWVRAGTPVLPERRSQGRPFKLLYVGKWSRRKGSDLLATIMGQLGEDFELRYTGTPPDRNALPTTMISLGWSTDRAEIHRWYAEADALLFPSRMEGLPLAVLEAQECGLPVIASDIASLPELIDDGWNGVLCPVDDVAAFVAGARLLRDCPDLWRQMQRNAVAWVHERYSEWAAVSAYLSLYEHLVTQPPDRIQGVIGKPHQGGNG